LRGEREREERKERKRKIEKQINNSGNGWAVGIALGPE
jgi:hypothetical protein